MCSLSLHITAVSCATMCYNTSNVTVDSNGMITASFTNLPHDVMYNTSLLVEYDSGLILTTNRVITSIILCFILLLFTINNRYS